jgi:predicted outer membrane protein
MSVTWWLRRTVSSGVLALLAMACGGTNAGDEQPAQAGLGDDIGATPNRRDTDPENVVHGVATFGVAETVRVAIALEEAGLDQARLAETKAVTTEVKAYARRMIEERSASLARLAAVSERAKSAYDDPTPGLVRREGKRALAEFEALEQGAFDLPFMTAETWSHARTLGLLEASLLPSASQGTVAPGTDGTARELERELITMHAAMVEDIVHALRVQGVLRAAEASIGGGTRPMAPGEGAGPKLPQ